MSPKRRTSPFPWVSKSRKQCSDNVPNSCPKEQRWSISTTTPSSPSKTIVSTCRNLGDPPSTQPQSSKISLGNSSTNISSTMAWADCYSPREKKNPIGNTPTFIGFSTTSTSHQMMIQIPCPCCCSGKSGPSSSTRPSSLCHNWRRFCPWTQRWAVWKWASTYFLTFRRQ